MSEERKNISGSTFATDANEELSRISISHSARPEDILLSKHDCAVFEYLQRFQHHADGRERALSTLLIGLPLAGGDVDALATKKHGFSQPAN